MSFFVSHLSEIISVIELETSLLLSIAVPLIGFQNGQKMLYTQLLKNSYLKLKWMIKLEKNVQKWWCISIQVPKHGQENSSKISEENIMLHQQVILRWFKHSNHYWQNVNQMFQDKKINILMVVKKLLKLKEKLTPWKKILLNWNHNWLYFKNKLMLKL